MAKVISRPTATPILAVLGIALATLAVYLGAYLGGYSELGEYTGTAHGPRVARDGPGCSCNLGLQEASV